MSTPRVHTYHCSFCSHLVLATTHALTTLPHRRAPGLDKALILPLPTAPKSTTSPHASDASSDEEDDDAPNPSVSPRKTRDKDSDSYTLLLALTRDRAPKIITREDGFEKRYLYRCGRCRLHVGYQLDEIHFELGPKSESHGMGTVIVGGGEAGAGKERSRKEKEKEKEHRYLYLLPAALVVTEELGKEGVRRQVELVEGAE